VDKGGQRKSKKKVKEVGGTEPFDGTDTESESGKCD